MLALILLVIFGLGVAFFATQNAGLTNIRIAGYIISGVPMYVAVIISLLLGVFISWLINLVDVISSTLTIHGKDSALQNANKTITTLEEEKHELEIENASLRGQKHEQIEESKKEYPRPSFLNRLKHSFGY